MAAKRASDFFDSYAHDFNAIYGTENTLVNSMINRLFRKSMKIRYIKSIEGCDPVKDRSVIDVGCGPGQYGIMLARMGAGRVCGVDFAKGMIELARSNAREAGVEDRCQFVLADFLQYRALERFDYAIVMGFMDYVENPGEVVEKVLSITDVRAFFSFPSDRGILAWQRRLRYRKRCELFMYNREQLKELFSVARVRRVDIDKISRDFFVTVHMG